MSNRSTTFSNIYANNSWGAGEEEFFSGPGSRGQAAENYASLVANILKDLRIKRVLDIGCGDFFVGRSIIEKTNDIHYIGVDICEELINFNCKKYSSCNVEFHYADACEEILPDAEVVLIRQVLMHLSNNEIKMILDKLSHYPLIITADDQFKRPTEVINLDKETSSDTRRVGLFLDKEPFLYNARKIKEISLDEENDEGKDYVLGVYAITNKHTYEDRIEQIINNQGSINKRLSNR
jgi:SAM-dependent methyltransferase